MLAWRRNASFDTRRIQTTTTIHKRYDLGSLLIGGWVDRMHGRSHRCGAETKVGSCMAADRSKGRALSSFDTSRWPRAVRRRPPPSSTIAEVEEEEEASGFRGVAAAEAASAVAAAQQPTKGRHVYDLDFEWRFQRELD